MSYKVKGGKLARRSKIDPRKIDSECDIQVDAKGGQYVMLCANAVGRRVVEDVFPDVEWTTDEIFSQCHSDKWLFTHIRVTRLPPHLENRIPLAFASPDSLGFAVALFLQRHHTVGRVFWYSGQGKDIEIGKFGAIPKYDPSDDDVALYGEYVPAGTPISEPVWGAA
jgi:hypothetical protein